MTLTRGACLLALVVLAVLPSRAPVRAQAAGDLFDNTVVHEVRLRLNTRDLAQLRARFRENTYYPADFTWQGTRVRNVAVRSRGSSSRSQTKLNLRVDFDRYIGGRRVSGQRALILGNLWNDPSLTRELIAAEVFERAGLPAPRTAPARVFINDVYEGLYALVEEVGVATLNRTLGESGGYLFEFSHAQEFFGNYLGSDINRYKPLFEPRTREREPDALVYGPIVDMFREINADFDGAWRDRTAAVVDVEAVIRQLALENFIAEGDGMVGAFGMNNFYLYRPAGSNRHLTFPKDKDTSFQSITHSLTHRLDTNVLFDRALQFEDWRALYFDVLAAAAAATASEGWFEQEVIRLTDLVREAATADTRKQFSTEEFEADVLFLREFARLRPSFVAAEIAALRSLRELFPFQN